MTPVFKETRMTLTRPLAAALALVLVSAPALAGSPTCQLDPRAAPSTPVLFKGVVRGVASPSEVAEQTAIAVKRTRAPESPAYVKMPRVFAFYVANGARHGTIAAVTSGDIPKAGEQVILASRHRDASQPCAFVPWTVIRDKKAKPAV
jgi:hypothetical protein